MATVAANQNEPQEVEMATAIVAGGTLVGGDIGGAAVPWWSFTKTVLAAAALVLADRGRLALDAPRAGSSYTLRQLLQHRAGLPDYGSLDDYHRAVARGEEPWPVAELLARVSGHAPACAPEARWMYSNVGYLFVRQMIEDAMGEGIGEALSRLVLAPLGITNASLAKTPEDLSATRWGNAGRYHPGWVYHGLLIGSPAAAALLLDRLMRGDLLSPAALRAMRDGFPLGGPIAGRPWRAPSYGLGLMIDAVAADGFIGHTGQGPSSTAAVYHFPAAAGAGTITATAFAPVDDQGVVERRVVDIARGVQAQGRGQRGRTC